MNEPLIGAEPAGEPIANPGPGLLAGPPPPLIDRFTPGETVVQDVVAVLHEERSPFQEIRILDLATHGRALILDGTLQSAAADEHLYHEALCHPALLLVGEPGARRVAILGGGEGATLREVLRHPTVERVVMVDLDRAVTDACRLHLTGHHAGAFDDARVQLLHQDAAAFLAGTAERFDALIVDLVDPAEAGPACHLFGAPFFRLLRDRLLPGGVLAMQYGAVFGVHVERAAAVVRTARQVFAAVRPGRVFVPSFLGCWGVLLAAARLPPLAADLLDERLARRLGGPTRSLDGRAAAALFELPVDLRVPFDEAPRTAAPDR